MSHDSGSIFKYTSHRGHFVHRFWVVLDLVPFVGPFTVNLGCSVTIHGHFIVLEINDGHRFIHRPCWYLVMAVGREEGQEGVLHFNLAVGRFGERCLGRVEGAVDIGVLSGRGQRVVMIVVREQAWEGLGGSPSIAWVFDLCSGQGLRDVLELSRLDVHQLGASCYSLKKKVWLSG